MTNNDEKITIYGVKTSEGYYLSHTLKDKNRFYDGISSLEKYTVNGKKLKSTFHDLWFLSEDKPRTIEKVVSMPNINYRYELIDKSLASDKIPMTIDRDDVLESDEYGESCWKKEYVHLQSLYKLHFDKQEPKVESVDFEYIEVAEIDEPIKSVKDVAYTTTHSFGRESLVTGNDAESQLLDKILFPSIMMGNRPKKFSSKQMYDIVREYVKQNIDSKVARVTSDYDFCFTVEKVIGLSNPYEFKTEMMKTNGKPYKKTKYNTRYISNRKVVVFEMTSDEDNYKGYTPIPAMVGDDIDDLKEKVDRYCQDLIKEINKPLKDCSQCGGLGVIEE